VDVAAGDTVPLVLQLSEPAVGTNLAVGTSSQAGSGHSTVVVVGGITTGVLAAGTIVAGYLAVKASNELSDLRKTYPTSHDALSAKASTVSSRALIADILGIATAVSGGITLTYALSRSPSHEVHVAVVPNGIQLAGSFR
jgi:hypothetical protein